jgi:hypothetical protein
VVVVRREVWRSLRQVIAVWALATMPIALPTISSSAQRTAEPEEAMRDARGGTGPWAFTADSFWNRRHNDTKAFPSDPNSSTYLHHLEDAVPSDVQYVELAGTDNNAWGIPYYRPDADTKLVTVTCEQPDRSDCYGFPRMGSGKPRIEVRLPVGAKPSDSDDSELTLVDRTWGTNSVYWFWKLCPPKPFKNAFCGARFDHWVATGMSAHALDSDGLDGCWERTFRSEFPNGDTGNSGHRGFPGAYTAIRYTEVADGRAIPHVLKLNIPNTGSNHWFPYVGDEDNGTDDRIPEGILLRIKPSIDLSRFNISPAARVIAEALQDFGAVVGDTSGSSAHIMVENLYVEGSSARWSNIGIGADSLSAIGLNNYEFVSRGAGGPSPHADPCARDPI